MAFNDSKGAARNLWGRVWCLLAFRSWARDDCLRIISTKVQENLRNKLGMPNRYKSSRIRPAFDHLDPPGAATGNSPTAAAGLYPEWVAGRRS